MTIKELKDFIDMVTARGVDEDSKVYVKWPDSTCHYEFKEEEVWFSLD